MAARSTRLELVGDHFIGRRPQEPMLAEVKLPLHYSMFGHSEGVYTNESHRPSTAMHLVKAPEQGARALPGTGFSAMNLGTIDALDAG